MSFRTEKTLAGYARAAVDLRLRMSEYSRGRFAQQYLRAWLQSRFDDDAVAGNGTVVEAFSRIAHQPWRDGEPYVLAPAMTAIIAAAAQALDLTGDTVGNDVAPSDAGVLFLPEPIYERGIGGEVTSIGAITWAKVHNRDSGRTGWWITGWADRDDPLDPAAARRREQVAEVPELAAQFGPYVLNTFAEIPIGVPIPAPDSLPEAVDGDWESAPDGRFCIDESALRMRAVAAVLYAFWRIQEQPIATVARPPLDRPARRRALRASLRHDTRVVMLRRTKPAAEPTGETKWHYRVRFIVRGHWRRLVNADGQPYRIWIHSHIKGPDGAPLLLGDTVSVLAR
ncbi:hypothetical protein [Micromonospora coxensis]|uniref:Uncharacterized protein n=1 Tax=Micromonospora coxensis TaxID=356852 RepID=A0A1C5GWD6_9ACTN|nr:hypothetical protein [Micromonospora coxensis]SCG38078.1 hypothetical protein GA0070614_0471 [Micromonospora coxensis]